MLIVYLVEGGGTSVELHILTTHLQRGENGLCEVVCIGSGYNYPGEEVEPSTRNCCTELRGPWTSDRMNARNHKSAY